MKSIDHYVDLISRYAIYGKNGYYIEPHIIRRIIVDELNLGMSFSEIENFVKTCEESFSEKSKSLFHILEDFDRIKTHTISKKAWDHLASINLHINEYGNLYVTDAVELVDAIIYNIKDLYDKNSHLHGKQKEKTKKMTNTIKNFKE